MSLPWFRADTNLPTHEKVLELLSRYGAKGKGAGFVYWCSLAYGNGHETDGVIRKAALPFVHGTPAEARMLVDVELWEVIENGWRIHNWGNRNPVGATSQAIHEIRSEAGKKGADARWAK